MGFRLSCTAGCILLVCLPATLQAEILVRWDQDQVPPQAVLGVSSLLVPAANETAVRQAMRQGYNVYLEVEPSALADFTPPPGHLAGIVVNGDASPGELRRLEQRLDAQATRVFTVGAGAKWPHIRTNWVTRRNDVLQVSSRTAQPWIENNAALIRIAQATIAGAEPLLAYAWQPITLSDVEEGPALENYLVAIAEAGSFGGNLALPLHERFQQGLLLGRPLARAAWSDIRRYLDFYSVVGPSRYRPIASIGVVTAEPMRWLVVMNLLSRHNLPFKVIDPERLAAADLESLDLLIALDEPRASERHVLAEFARNGGVVVVASGEDSFPWRSAPPIRATEARASYEFGKGRAVELIEPIADPNEFALEVRQILGREKRPIDIWNGITVLTAPYEDPDGQSVLVTMLNYAHQALPVQVRVRGTFSLVHYEAPEEALTLLPYQHRDGHTEFVVPALRIGARVFLSRD